MDYLWSPTYLDARFEPAIVYAAVAALSTNRVALGQQKQRGRTARRHVEQTRRA